MPTILEDSTSFHTDLTGWTDRQTHMDAWHHCVMHPHIEIREGHIRRALTL